MQVTSVISAASFCALPAIGVLAAAIASYQPTASPITIAPSPMISRCITQAWSGDGGQTWSLFCTNPCTAGCISVEDGIEGQGTGSSCACAGGIPHVCCHLVLLDSGVPMPTPGGCGEGNCSSGSCQMTVVSEPGGTWEAWAECEDN